MPASRGSEMNGRGAERWSSWFKESPAPVDDAVAAYNLLDFRQFFATVHEREAVLVFAIRPPIFCRPTSSKPVSDSKAF